MQSVRLFKKVGALKTTNQGTTAFKNKIVVRPSNSFAPLRNIFSFRTTTSTNLFQPNIFSSFNAITQKSLFATTTTKSKSKSSASKKTTTTKKAKAATESDKRKKAEERKKLTEKRQKEREREKDRKLKEKERAAQLRKKEKEKEEKAKALQRERVLRLREKKKAQDAKERQKKMEAKEKLLAEKKAKEAKPKRAKTPFAFFFQENFESIYKQKGNLPAVTQELARRWKEMSNEQKQKYNDMQTKDKARHSKEMEAYKKTLPPKRPQSSFMLFFNEVRTQIVKEKPDAKPTEIAKEVSNKWRGLDQSARDAYKKRADAARAEYDSKYKK